MTTNFITPANQQSDEAVLHFILDKSGSMESIASDAIGGFNAFVTDQRALGTPAKLTLTQFSYTDERTFTDMPIEHVTPLTRDNFRPGGGTALLDTIGKTLGGMLESVTTNNVIISIMTDGEENSSRYYNASTVKAMITQAQARGWQVLFLGANMDAMSVAKTYGINVSNVATFDANSVGATAAMKTMSQATSAYRGGARSFDVSATYASNAAADQVNKA